MAIAFARPEYVSRSNGSNACCKGAYNARSKILDEKTNVTYNFSNRPDNVHHEVLLPEHVDTKFKDTAILANEVERTERKKNSQLYVEWLLALPKEENVSLELKLEMVHEFIRRKEWVKEGLAVQVDIHKPHADNVNWHAHLLVTTRRFTEDGKELGAKARDLQPEVKCGRVQKTIEIDNNIFWRNVQNDLFKAHGMSNAVDLNGELTQEHIGPVRMRSVLNQAVDRNEERKVAEIERLNSGYALLDKVTHHISVFTKDDLMRATKCLPDIELREKLVEEALSDKSTIALFQQDGNKTQCFTTLEVRAEETKLLRLSSYVANGDSVFLTFDGKALQQSQHLLGQARNNLTEEQHIALSKLATFNASGLNILRGRAGSGKSHVLRHLASIAKASNVNVIGLAPTHKAKEVLASDGFERTDTIKGMLFKLHNARFSLPKHSLLVVDEAGMVGNDDYKELLRVAATRKCNVVLAGDEKQLASVQRGGMFEVFADKYGSSTILDIKRQDSSWGKSVAMAMSEGNVKTAISILEQEKRIKWKRGSEESMRSLVSDWDKSSYALKDRLILAVKNDDVIALNNIVRHHLQLDGRLTGSQIRAAGNHYMKGDRILITKTNKELGVVNGEMAEILEVSRDRFVISTSNTNTKTDKAKMVEFNPAEYTGFRHGYATTIFKAQGASIKDVYVYHNGFAGIRNSYVALSRNINELALYVNNKATNGINHLIKQLSYDHECASSLGYLTSKELEEKELDRSLETHSNFAVRAANSALCFVARTATKLVDQYLPASEYYNYREPKQETVTVEKVTDQTREENHNVSFSSEFVEEKLVVGGNYKANNTMNIKNSINTLNALNTNNATDTNTSSNLRLVQHHEASNQYVDRCKAKAKEQSIEARKVRHTNKSLAIPIDERSTEKQECLEVAKSPLVKSHILEALPNVEKGSMEIGAKTEESSLKDYQNTTDIQYNRENTGFDIKAYAAIQQEKLKQLTERHNELRSLKAHAEQNEKYNLPEPKQINVTRVLRDFDGSLTDYKVLKESINDLQRFGKPKDLHDALTLLKEKDIYAMKRHTINICSNNITDGLNKDFLNIRKGEKVEFLVGKYNSKSDYLTTVSKDENIMKYITPKSEIGQQIENQQTRQNQHNRCFELGG